MSLFQSSNRVLTSYGFSRNQRRCVYVMLMILLLYIIYYILGSDSSINGSVRAIVVLGGGLTADGQVPDHTQLRLNKAFELFKADSDGLTVIITLSGGTPHKPNPLDKNGFPVWESSAAAKKLVEMGIPSDKVFEENFSLDTLGNAYFLRTVHIDAARYNKLTVVTNEWHMDRTMALFNHVFNLPLTNSYYNRLFKKKYHIEYVRVAPGMNDETMLKTRKEKELASLQSFESTIKHEFDSMVAFHDWIFTKHNAYATSRHGRVVDKLDPELLKSY